jgi:alginate O-acetyltransferase complex protein AlgI
MLFNSVQFALFFLIVTGLYFSINHKYRWFLLLASSCYFYMCFIPVYILILAFTIVVDYFAGLWIENSTEKKKKYFLIASLFANIGVLAIFKYYNFINENITVLLHGFNLQNSFPSLSIILPIGLSFHTFQAMSYTIEVYRGRQKAERKFGIYALYVMFYPQLVAGPIERPQNLIHQFYEVHTFDYDRVTSGLKLMLWGFFKKIVIADRLALLVNKVYDHPANYEGFPLILATILFSFQIFCDFSGYSDIAIGAARVMGFKLMTNFNRPYFSKSVSEFWKRWHISLSSWFRDYLYISLGGNRVSVPRWYLNLFIVFLLSGLWHGANFTFVIWGALHGLYLILNLIFNHPINWFYKITGLDKRNLIKKILQISVTFSLVTFSWIFFRAKTFDDSIYIATHLFSGLSNDLSNIVLNTNNARSDLLFLGFDYKMLIVAATSILFMEFVHFIQRHKSISDIMSQKPGWVRWTVYYFIVVIILFFGVIDHSQQFIYFQF